MYVIMVYDIELKDYVGNKVLRKVFKLSKEYLNHVQNSVFEGEMSEGQLMQLKYELKDVIREDKDSVIFFSSSKEEWLAKEILGVNKNAFSNLL
jgi:CRISPR-associated protein Cas2